MSEYAGEEEVGDGKSMIFLCSLYTGGGVFV